MCWAPLPNPIIEEEPARSVRIWKLFRCRCDSRKRIREIELRLALQLYPQAEALKRRPVCVFKQFFLGLHGLAQSQTISWAMSLPTQVRIGLGAFFAFGNPTLGSLQVARPRVSERGYRKVSNIITRTKTGKPK